MTNKETNKEESETEERSSEKKNVSHIENEVANTLQTSKHSMNWLYQFFCWCSGARIYILKQCPTDYNTFLGIGIVIFLTGVMASLSGSYAFFTVFKDPQLAAIFGLFWGCLIFFLDWYLVSSLKKQNDIKKELLLSIPRFIFAFFLAIVIAKPVEMKLFESEIQAEITSYNLKKGKKHKKTLDESFAEISKLETDNETMALQIKMKESQRNELFSLVIDEAEGRSGTGHAGKGPVYKEKKDALVLIEKELVELKETLLPLIKSNSERILKLRTLKDKQSEVTSEATENADGFLARIEAMNRLTRKSTQTEMVSLFITLLFLCIESAPIFVKLISSRGAYDRMLDVLVERQKLDSLAKIAELNSEYMYSAQMVEDRVKQEVDMSIEKYTTYLEQLGKAKDECNSKLVEEWKRRELDKIDKNFVQYLPKIQSIFNPKSES